MALKDKLMTLEDFKAVRDVDVASNSAQFTEIKADLGEYEYDVIDGGFINSNGTVSVSDTYSYTSYINIAYGVRLLTYTSNDNSRHAFYDTNKAFISAENDYTHRTLTELDVPENARYIRVSIYTNRKAEIVIKPIASAKADIKNIEYIDTVKAQSLQNAADINGLAYYPLTLKDDYYVSADGTDVSNTSYSVTDYIRLNGSLSILTYVADDGSRHAFYDKDKVFISAESDYSHRGTLTAVTIPQNAEYVRVSVYKNQKSLLVVAYNSVNAAIRNILDNVSYIKQPICTFDAPTRTDGRYVSRYTNQEGNTANDTASCVTGYVEVIPGTIVRISGLYLQGNRTVATYDRNKTVIECLTSEATSKTSMDVNVGANVRYIRATGRTGVTPQFKYLTLTTAKELSEYKNRNAFNTMYAHSADRPALSIIDDDTWGVEYVSEIKAFCDTIGIKISFACLTSRFEISGEENLASTLLTYEREGFTVLTHGYTQGDFYNTGVNRNLVQAEADLVHGLQDLHLKGFTDYKACWVTPFGRYDADLRNLAKKHGFESLVRYAYDQQVENPTALDPEQRYKLYRYAFADETHLATIKSLIDKAVACNGWVMVGIHSAQAANRTQAFKDALSDMVAYATTQGCVITTLNEELRHRMPIYNYYELY